jgi:APA family basic amino acid/polyamine antiporter
MTSATNSKPVFERGRSGYVRDFNAVDVFIFNAFGFSLGLALSTNPPFIGSFAPSSNIVIVIVLGAALAVANGLVYGWFGGMMPSTGGDYVFVGRSLTHRLGFVTSWGFTACQIYGMAIDLGWLLSVGIAPALLTLGTSLRMQGLLDAGGVVTKPGTILVGSVVLLFVYFALAYIDIGLNRLVVYPLFVLGILGPVLMAWILYTHSHQDFVTMFNGFMQKYRGLSNAYELAISTGRANGLQISAVDVWRASFRALPLGFLCFLGFTYSVYVGGEIREPRKAQIRGIVSALMLGVVAFVFCMGRYVDVVGREFHSAIGMPAVQEKLGLGINSLNLFTGVMASSSWLNLMMQVGTLIWFLLVPYVILQVCTHNLIAWTTDRMMPDRLLGRRGRANAPLLAILVVCVVALACIGANYFFGFTLVGAAALAGVAFFFTGIGAFYLPRHRPEIFAKAPAIAQRGVFGTTLFQLLGLLSALGFVWLIYASVRYPEISGGTSLGAVIALIIVYGTGFLVYELNKARLQRRVAAVGLDLDALFKEIPTD